MKILVICQYYAPEPFQIASICEALAARGHEVHVVTGYPNYPEGRLYPGYGAGKHIDETINKVHIHRCFTIPRRSGPFWRILNYFSFPISSKSYVSSKACCTSDGGDFDVVFCNQLSPINMAEAALAYRSKKGKPVVLYCLDLWPESLIAGGIKRQSSVYALFNRISRRIYTEADEILVPSQQFASYLRDYFGLSGKPINYLPQFADPSLESVGDKEPGETCELMFAGNIGEAQSLDTILNAAKILRNDHVRFHIVGSGKELERLQEMKKTMNLDNVTFYGRQPANKMVNFYSKADAMLVTLKADSFLSMTVPAKVQSYLAAGKPVISAVDGETRRILEEADCGYCGPAEDAETLAKNVRLFIMKKDKEQFARNAKAYYQAHYSMSAFILGLEKSLREVKKL